MQILSIELSYQRILTILKSSYSSGLKLTALIKFLNTLFNFPEQAKLISYYTELTPELFTLIRHSDYQCFPPEDIENIFSITNQLKSKGFAPDDSIKFVEIQNILLYALGNQNENLKSSETDFNNAFSSNNVAIVLVENCEEESAEEIKHIGHIHRLNISSSFRNKSESTDKIELINHIDISDTKIVEHLNKVINIIKNKYVEKHSYYNFTFYFDKTNFIYCGTSLGIGAICLTYNSMLINNYEKYYYKFRSDCVFSGEMDDEGCLQKLNNEILKIKLKTVFYSGYKKFVIPDDNLSEAKSELELLQKNYPDRKLILIPIRNFESVFTNLEIVERCELKFKQKLKVNINRYQKLFNAVFSILIFAVIILWIIKFVVPYLDRNPVTGVFKDSKYYAYNKNGYEVWEYTEPEINIFEKDLYPDHFFKQIISVVDIDNDETNEIIYANNMGSSKMIEKDFIICCNSDNKIKWKYQIPRKDFYYDWESDSLQGDWLFRQVLVDDINNDGKKEIYATAFYCPFFPNRLVVLNNEGKLVSEYWHSGYFNYMTDFDIDGDGKKELVAMGINNYPGYRCGCLLVFDPNVIQGASFKTDPLKTGIKGTEKYCIIFPKTFLTKFNVSGFNIADYLVESGQNFDINVLDGPFKRNVLNNAILVYQFDKNMNVINISTSDQFLQVYNELLSEGKIQPIPNMKSYLDSLKTQVQWWDGDKFVNHPVLNRNYLDAKGNK